MPELPDIVNYVEALRERILAQRLVRIRVANPFLVRTFDPPLDAVRGCAVIDVRRLGKRIVLAMEAELFLVLHLMIAGRLKWTTPAAKIPGKIGLAAFDFEGGALLLTEAGSKRRASLHLVLGEKGVAALDPGGIEVLDSDLREFRSVLQRENHTLKRALTDPHAFSGIGNAYSDEILHRAQLSPVKLTHRMTTDEVTRLFQVAQATLREWTERLAQERSGMFPEKVTAFHPKMAVHGKFGQPCPVCGSPVQRIVYADNETNYCARCQTGGKLLADRALSRLLRSDWPRSLDELDV